jgi:hypothetical protein
LIKVTKISAKTHMQPDRNITSGIAVLIISSISMVILAYFGIKYFRNQQNLSQGEVLGIGSDVKPVSPTPEQPTNAATPPPENISRENWTVFENREDGYRLQHPPDTEVSLGADGYTWIYRFVDPATPGVGDYEGIAVRIRSQLTQNRGLKEIAEEDSSNQQVAQIVQEVQAVSINGVEGYQYSARALGTYKKVFLPVAAKNTYLEIISSADDSDENQYAEISDQIIASIEIIG